MKEIVVLSLDFDCCADILFEEGQEQGAFKVPCETKPGYKTVTQELRTVFEDLLSEETAGADEVELFVGSVRQFRQWDRFSSTHQRKETESNGLCFELYADLAERKQWYFNRLLLADFELDSGVLREQPLTAGTAMGPLQKNDSGKHKYVADYFADGILGPVDKFKTRILSRQIESVCKKYPDDNITFVFIDDVLDITNKLTAFFNPDNGFCLPANLTLKIIHHDPSDLFNQPYRSIADNHTIRQLAKDRIYYRAIIKGINANMQAAASSDDPNNIKMPAGLFFKAQPEDHTDIGQQPTCSSGPAL